MLKSAFVIIATLAGVAHAELPAPVAMDGPVPDVCKYAASEPKLASAARRSCKRATSTRVAGAVVVVYRLDDDPYADYLVAVEQHSGWLVSPDVIRLELQWKEHGPSVSIAPRAPVIKPLSLASKRGAFSVRIPNTVTECPDDGPCTSVGSATALTACGKDEDGAWMCLPATSTATGWPDPPSFDSRGRLHAGQTPDWADVSEGDHVAF